MTSNRLNCYRALIQRGGGVLAIGGHLILHVSDKQPISQTNVVHVDLSTATPELIAQAIDEAQRPELKRIITR